MLPMIQLQQVLRHENLAVEAVQNVRVANRNVDMTSPLQYFLVLEASVSTMRLHAVVCDNCTPCKVDGHYSPLHHTLNYRETRSIHFAMADTGRISTIIASAVEILFNDSLYGPRLSNCWLPASTLVEALSKLDHIDASLINIDARKLNDVAMSISHLYHHNPDYVTCNNFVTRMLFF